MGAYKRVKDDDYNSMRVYDVPATFSVPIGKYGQPILNRKGSECARATVVRSGDQLYFHKVGIRYELYLIPESEYRFVEGDVNTDVTGFDSVQWERYLAANSWCAKHDCGVWELDGFERCPGSVLKVGADAKVPQKAPSAASDKANGPKTHRRKQATAKRGSTRRVSEHNRARKDHFDDSTLVSGWSSGYFAVIAGL